MSDIWSALGPIGQFVLSAFTGGAAIAAFYWSNIRPQAKRLGVIDLATKQIAFWDQALKLELSATIDSHEQEKVKSRALAAVRRIRSHADKELNRLTWAQKTNDLIFEKRTLFHLRWPSCLKGWQKFEWFAYKALFW